MAAFLALWLALLLAKGTPAGRWLNRWMVEKPAALCTRIGVGGMLLILLVAVGVALVWWVAQADGIAMLSMGAPEIIHALAALEVSTYLEVLVTVVATASATRWSAVKVVIRSLLPARRERRVRRTRTQRPPANDDDRPGLALAA